MWDLNNTQAKEFVIKYLNGFLEAKNFTLKKTQNTNIHFIRKTKSGHDDLYISFLDSYPGKKVNYMLMKRIEPVEKIVAEIIRVVDPNQIIGKNDFTFATSYGKVKDLRRDSYMPEMVNEKDVEGSCNLLIKFLETTGLVMADRFENIQELDKEINGENYWKSDEYKSFDLRLHFDIKRIVIAYLAENPNLDDVIERTFEIMSQNSNGTYYNYDRKDLSLRLPYTVHYLQNLRR